MKVDRDNDKVTITMNSKDEAVRLMKMLDYAQYVELTNGMKEVSDEEIEKLADEVNLAGYHKRVSLK
jgi:dsDNA-binding SOS-regulon protein